MYTGGFPRRIPVVEFLDDIAIDAPKAFVAIMLRGAGFERPWARAARADRFEAQGQ